MKALTLAALCGVLLLAATMVVNGSAVQQPANAAGPCGLPQAAFCDMFATTFTGGGRSGQLDPARWSVTRQLAGMPNAWAPSSIPLCDQNFGAIVPDDDVKVCPGGPG